jgi:thioester reductase-like protein
MNTSTSSAIAERISHDPVEADILGYPKSKWAAQNICFNASKFLPRDEKRKAEKRVNVVRVGQPTGDSKNEVWNMTEA